MVHFPVEVPRPDSETLPPSPTPPPPPPKDLKYLTLSPPKPIATSLEALLHDTIPHLHLQQRLRMLVKGEPPGCKQTLRDRVAYLYPNVDVVVDIITPQNVHMVETQRFPDSFFDIIMLWNVHAITDRGYWTCASECRRLLKPGGFLHFAVPGSSFLADSPAACELLRWLLTVFDLRVFDPDPYSRMILALKKLDFEVELKQTRYISMLDLQLMEMFWSCRRRLGDRSRRDFKDSTASFSLSEKALLLAVNSATLRKKEYPKDI